MGARRCKTRGPILPNAARSAERLELDPFSRARSGSGLLQFSVRISEFENESNLDFVSGRVEADVGADLENSRETSVRIVVDLEESKRIAAPNAAPDAMLSGEQRVARGFSLGHKDHVAVAAECSQCFEPVS
jgi:hypothetical protein